MDLSLISGGERIIQVVGESGSGLSLLARYLHERVPGTAVMRQDAEAHVTYLRDTVIEEVCIGLEQRGIARDEMLARAEAMLAAAGLSHLTERNPSTLSGGETRRLAFAAVAILDPDVLVLDDPFAGLDADSARLIRAFLARSRPQVVVLGHTFHHDLGGQCLSLIDATLSTTTPPTTTVELPLPVEPSGDLLDLGVVGARRGGRRGLFSRARSDEFTLEPVRVVANPGAVVWLRGPNGAGKTTLLRALAGLDGAHPPVEAALALQRSADQVAESTVGEFLGSVDLARARGFDPEEHPLDLSARDLRLAQLAQVFAYNRPLVLLDEPDVGLDTLGRTRAHAEIAAGLSRGAAIVLTCHDPSFVAEMGQYAGVEELELG
ncbi:ATP-binding cassette domain-containing protein [Corynebacterium sp. LK2510]|uniref:ATP-binding cassette domain-containing protein n=1 Tax=Corynebacterium sp. LK2510 TaxID=3110472 RepID=UPI0034CDC604